MLASLRESFGLRSSMRVFSRRRSTTLGSTVISPVTEPPALRVNFVSCPTSKPWYINGVEPAFRPLASGRVSLTMTPRWLCARSAYRPKVSSAAAGLELAGESKAIAPFTSAARLSSFTFAPLKLRSASTPETFQKRLPFFTRLVKRRSMSTSMVTPSLFGLMA